MSGRIISILCVIVVVAGIIFLGIGYKNYSLKQNETAAMYAELSAKLSDLETERRTVQGKLLALEKEIDAATDSKATLNIIFTGMSDVIFTEILPVMTEYGFTGVLAMSSENLPGEEGKLTDDQIVQLVDAGWKLLPQWSANGGITQVEKWLSQYGYVNDGAVLIDIDSCTPEVETALASSGYNTLILRINGGTSDAVSTDEVGDMWKPAAIGYLYEERKAVLSNAVKTSGHMAFLVGFDETRQNELYGTKVFASMLTYLDGYSDDGELGCMSVSESRTYRTEMDVRRREANEKVASQKAEYEAQLAEIQKEIDKVYGEYK